VLFSIALVLLSGAPRLAGADCNRNGLEDDEEIESGAVDCDANDVLDECEVENFVRFAPVEELGYSFLPVALAAGDLDGDSDLDLVVQNGPGSHLLFAVNHRNTYSIDLMLGPASIEGASRVIALDVDADEELDILTLSPEGRALGLMRGLGAMRFTQPAVTSVGVEPVQFWAGDLDGDESFDLLVADAGADSLLALELGSDDEFLLDAAHPAGRSPRCLAVADFNQDGLMDAALGGPGSEEVTVLSSEGEDTFTAVASLPYPGGTSALAAGDVNRDGRQDLVAASAMTSDVTVSLGASGGGFPSSATSRGVEGAVLLFVADLFGQPGSTGDPEVAVLSRDPGRLNIFAHRGQGTLQEGTGTITVSEAFDVAIGDLDGYGLLDVAIAGQTQGAGQLHTYRSAWSGFEGPKTQTALSPTITPQVLDLDGDGDGDLVGGDSGGESITVLRNDGPAGLVLLGSFASVQIHPASVKPVDMDGDGDPDLVVGNHPRISPVNYMSVLRNRGDGSFDPAVNYRIGTSDWFDPSGVLPDDFDADGDVDVALWRDSDGLISIFANNGLGDLTRAQDVPLISGTAWAFSADLDSDADVDFLLMRSWEAFLIRNKGQGDFLPSEVLRFENSIEGAMCADINGDGSPDIIKERETSNLVCVRLNDGNGRFSPARCFTLEEPRRLQVGDVDGDEDQDLVVGVSLPHQPFQQGIDRVAVLLNDGDGVFRHAGESSIPLAFNFRLGDLNGDVRLDLLTRPREGHNLWISLHEASQTGVDCNANGVPDACDMASGVLHDGDEDGTADECQRSFHRGDSDGSGRENLADVMFVLAFLFLGTTSPGCLDAADSNDDGDVNVADGIYMLNYLFLGERAPPAPGASGFPCGRDSNPPGSPGSLGCEHYNPCV
jgi:hypothetical protein